MEANYNSGYTWQEVGCLFHPMIFLWWLINSKIEVFQSVPILEKDPIATGQFVCFYKSKKSSVFRVSRTLPGVEAQ